MTNIPELCGQQLVQPVPVACGQQLPSPYVSQGDVAANRPLRIIHWVQQWGPHRSWHAAAAAAAAYSDSMEPQANIWNPRELASAPDSGPGRTAIG